MVFDINERKMSFIHQVKGLVSGTLRLSSKFFIVFIDTRIVQICKGCAVAFESLHYSFFDSFICQAIKPATIYNKFSIITISFASN